MIWYAYHLEKKIKKEKPLAEIAEDEIPFDIPENWKWVQLGNLASINGGFAFKSTNYRNVGDSPAINVYTLADIELQFSEDSAGNKKLLPASLLPGFTQALSAEEETDINIHFETSEVKALICELRKASEKTGNASEQIPAIIIIPVLNLLFVCFLKT